jgi:Lon protease-like protein
MEALGPLARPHDFGCLAQITRTERLSQGRLNIVAVGGERIRIHDVDSDTYPYMVGQVELFPLLAPETDELAAADKKLRAWVQRYLAKLAESGRALVNLKLLPAEPVMLAYLAATLLQIPAEQKQPLLEATDAIEMISALHRLYRRELMLLDVLLHADAGDDDDLPFSLS